MLVLFDNGTPRTLPAISSTITPSPRPARGGDQLENGELLTEAEAAGLELVVTTDRNLRFQQNLAGRKIAIVVLGKGRWTIIKPHIAKIVAAVNAATPGSYAEIEIPE